MLGLLAKKMGMSQIFGAEGEMIPVTVLEVGPCVVVDRRTKKRDGYNALQIGLGKKKKQRTNKPDQGRFTKLGVEFFQHVKEFRADEVPELASGHVLDATVFQEGDIVHVRGTSKGRGFQGVMKRHGKAGGPAAHGSGFHRTPGSIGQRAQPGRVMKNMKLPGHMGDETVMTKNLKVVGVRPEHNIILVRGAVPGTRNGIVEIFSTDKAFGNRDAFKVATANAQENASA